MFGRFAMVLPVLALIACSEQETLTYQGRPAATALECEAAFQGAKQRLATTPVIVSGVGGLVGAAIGAGMVSGMNESHYKACLARVANAAPGSKAYVPVPVASAAATAAPTAARTVAVPYRKTQTRTPGCMSGGGVMQGGAGYCIGN